MKKNYTYPSQEGKTIIVTGANTGLGFETAKELARLGAHVIMACRNLQKAEAAKERIEAEVSGAQLEVLKLDLSSLASVREFAAKFLARHGKLDVLINNAGIMMPPYSKTEDGFESQLGANFLGHFLLTGLLLDRINQTPGGRVVTLSSLVHKNGVINFDDLQSEQRYNPSTAYAQSKLACLMFTHELQRRLEAAGHKTLSLASHPGIATTELSRHMPKLVYNLLRFTVAPFLTHSPYHGAQPSIMAATSAASGADYFGPTGFREFKGPPGKATRTEASRDTQVAKRLWEVSQELVGYAYL